MKKIQCNLLREKILQTKSYFSFIDPEILLLFFKKIQILSGKKRNQTSSFISIPHIMLADRKVPGFSPGPDLIYDFACISMNHHPGKPLFYYLCS